MIHRADLSCSLYAYFTMHIITGKMHMLQSAHVTKCTGCKVHRLKGVCVAKCTCFKVHMLLSAHIATCNKIYWQAINFAYYNFHLTHCILFIASDILYKSLKPQFKKFLKTKLINLLKHVASYTCCQLHVLPVIFVASCKCWQLHVLPVVRVASCTCCQLHMLPVACVTCCMCCQLRMLPDAHVASCTCC